jgi:hypothetical protein
LAENVEPLSIFPNPAQDEIYFSLPDENDENIEISIYNFLGINLLKTKIDNRTSKLDISTLVRGIYILKAKTISGTYFASFIKY